MPIIYKRLRNDLDAQEIRIQKRKKAQNKSAVITMLTAVMMLTAAIPTTGLVMAEEAIETQRVEVADTVNKTAEKMNDNMNNDVAEFFEKVKFLKAPNVKGLKVKAAKTKLVEDFDVKIEHKKMTYEQLAAKSDTVFFGEVGEQSQDMDKVTLKVIDPDMEDPLTVEMMNFGGRLAWPVPTSQLITSHFGHRASPGGIGSTNHKGMDIAAPTGAPIIAAKEGTVKMASVFGGYGNCVIIEHENGYETLYGHMSEITCNAGDKVKPGDVIGKVGSTGASTGPHLHFGISKDGVFVDPEPYLTGRNFIEPGEEVSENVNATTDKSEEGDKNKDKDKEKKEKSSDDKAVKETEQTKDKQEAKNKQETSEESTKKKEESTQPTTKPATKPATQPTTQPTQQQEPEKEPTQPTTQPVTHPEPTTTTQTETTSAE